VKDGEIICAIGKIVFQDVEDLKRLARRISQLEHEIDYYKEELRKTLGGKYTFDDIVGNNESIQRIKKMALRTAKGSSSVLILGESGTGKELFAHSIHNASTRCHGPFIKVNCAAIPEGLLESELFGYEEGAFSGARKGGKPGKIELANNGTLFLDEICDMPLTMQVKLLRVLQERELERLGGTKTIKLDVRVITASNRDLGQLTANGQFRSDLYYRLNIVALTIPPLRERKDDIPLLCEVLLRKINHKLGRFVDTISPECMAELTAYHWPGNIRELENVLERAVNIMDEGVCILKEHLPCLIPAPKCIGTEDLINRADLLEARQDAERNAIMKAMAATGGNKSKAAKMLRVNRSVFYDKLKKYNIK
jgi:transcriptional regulator with PAS, ATPase and Fis domain